MGILIYKERKNKKGKGWKDLKWTRKNSHQSFLKWQIIFVHTEKMPPRNPIPTRLRLPLAYPPRQEVAFDSESNALCTKPQWLANEFKSNKVTKMLMLTMYTTYAHAVPHHGGLVAIEDLLLKIKDCQVLVFLNLRLNGYIKYVLLKFQIFMLSSLSI